MAKNSINSREELIKNHYSFGYALALNIRRFAHIYLWVLAALMIMLPQYPVTWGIVAAIIFMITANHRVRDENAFGVGYGPYLKPNSNPKKGGSTIEEWSVIDAPPDKGGDGSLAFGNNRFTREEVYANDDKVRRHILVFGTTGSGKTVSLQGLMYQAVVSGSGLIFVDGKSDPKTWFELYAIAAACGRTEDLLVLNFVVGAGNEAEWNFDLQEELELWEEFRAVESNTYNLFGTGSADTLSELGIALLGNEGGGDNKMWQDRAEALLKSLMKALCALRDDGYLQTSIQALRSHMVLDVLAKLETDDRVPEFARLQIQGYLDELPGYRDAANCEDPQQRANLMEQPNKQHGFLTMQFTGLFSMLSGTYRHICEVEYSDIYFPDVVYNRRILMVMLPALEKSPSSLASLGRMAVAGIKSALSQAISGRLSGSKKEIVDRRPTNAPRALLAIMDEYGSYAVDGFGDVVAQARSLGVSAIFAGQEYAGFKKAGEDESQRIVSNTGITLYLKTEDTETAKMAQDRIGKTQILQVTGKVTRENGSQRDSDPSYQEVERLEIQDLTNLSEGQGYLVYNNTLIPINMPYVQVPATKKAYRMDLIPLPGSTQPDRRKERLRYEQNCKDIVSKKEPLDVGRFIKAQKKSITQLWVDTKIATRLKSQRATLTTTTIKDDLDSFALVIERCKKIEPILRKPARARLGEFIPIDESIIDIPPFGGASIIQGGSVKPITSEETPLFDPGSIDTEKKAILDKAAKHKERADSSDSSDDKGLIIRKTSTPAETDGNDGDSYTDNAGFEGNDSAQESEIDDYESEISGDHLPPGADNFDKPLNPHERELQEKAFEVCNALDRIEPKATNSTEADGKDKNPQTIASETEEAVKSANQIFGDISKLGTNDPEEETTPTDIDLDQVGRKVKIPGKTTRSAPFGDISQMGATKSPLEGNDSQDDESTDQTGSARAPVSDAKHATVSAVKSSEPTKTVRKKLPKNPFDVQSMVAKKPAIPTGNAEQPATRDEEAEPNDIKTPDSSRLTTQPRNHPDPKDEPDKSKNDDNDDDDSDSNDEVVDTSALWDGFSN